MTLDDDSALPDSLRNARYRVCDIYEAPDWYDVDYAGYRGEEQFYQLVLSRNVKPGGVVVELGAGTGRLTLRLVDAGYSLHGVEPSRAMRARFAAKCKKARVRVDVEDARAVDFVGPKSGRVDVVMFPFNGLLHTATRADMHASFGHVRDQLDDDGRFALDITGPYWDAMLRGGTAWGKVDERVHPESGRTVLTCDRYEYVSATRQIHIHIRYLLDGAREGVEVELVQTMWTWQEVLGALDDAGFAVDVVFGDVNMAPFDEGSPRLLVSARKR